MKPMKYQFTGKMSPVNENSTAAVPNAVDLEIRPGGMLVQARNSDFSQNSASVLTIRVKVKYGMSYHEVNINSQASFGELKKMLAGPTRLHAQDQKLTFKGKERESKAYLDVAGVKDGSKLVLVEDLASRERRVLELRRSATMEKASKSISEISLEVDKLADQVLALGSAISSGGKVLEKDVMNLTELLMAQLIKLDGIIVNGDLKLQRRLQVKRVQNYIETLDGYKVRISKKQQQKQSFGKLPTNAMQQKQQQNQRNSAVPTVVTTNWEKFDSSVTLESRSSSTNNNPNAKLIWEFFE